MGITRPRPDGGVIMKKKMCITRPCPDGGVERLRPVGGVSSARAIIAGLYHYPGLFQS